MFVSLNPKGDEATTLEFFYECNENKVNVNPYGKAPGFKCDMSSVGIGFLCLILSRQIRSIRLLLFHSGNGKSLQNETEFFGWMINNLLVIYISGGHNSCPNSCLEAIKMSGAPKAPYQYLLTLKETVTGQQEAAPRRNDVR